MVGKRVLSVLVLAGVAVAASSALRRVSAEGGGGSIADVIREQLQKPVFDAAKEHQAAVYARPVERQFSGSDLATVQRLISEGKAGFDGKGYVGLRLAGRAPTSQDVRELAEIKCRQAVREFGLPESMYGPCVHGVVGSYVGARGRYRGRWEYARPGLPSIFVSVGVG